MMARNENGQRRRWWLGVVGAGVTVAAVAALVLAARPSEEPATPQRPAGATLMVPDVRVRAAAFAGGQEFVLSEHGSRPAILYFMASWCLTCIPEAKALVQLDRELGDHVTIVVLDIDPEDTEPMLERFAAAVGGHPGVWALDTGNAVTRAYNVRSLDTTVIVAGGREVARTFGPQSLDQLRAAVQRAEQTGQ